jgi:glycosyltransferase domain-containing protein
MTGSFEDITLLIPTHNRPAYLSRILEYYQYNKIKIVIVDSSVKMYEDVPGDHVSYFHLQGIPLPRKIAYGLDKVTTKFVLLCADDDFILPSAILKCVSFLEENKSYASAQGNAIHYKKRSRYKGFVELNLLYDETSFEISDEDPFKRLYDLFHPYRSIIYAVHFTKNLRFAYKDFPDGITNLYLNEYLAAIVPILFGKHRVLPIFYQVREYSSVSDDKTTANLDAIFEDGSYEGQLNLYLSFLSQKISVITGKEMIDFKGGVSNTLQSFARILKEKRINGAQKDHKKKIGNIIQSIPVIGEKIVLSRRLKIQQSQISQVVKDQSDQLQLEAIKKLIFKYGELVA